MKTIHYYGVRTPATRRVININGKTIYDGPPPLATLMIPTKDQCLNLYAGAFNKGLTTDLQGWHADEPIFEELMNRVKPATYIEVGSWKGASMARIGHLATFLGLDLQCYAVDLWDAKPGLYDQFLHNMLAMSLADHVVPIRGNSFDAARALMDAGIKADLIYIDADHTRPGCLSDIVCYYSLLKPGGIMFGDDYTEEKGVTEAVRIFCDLLQIRPEVTTYYHWQLPPKK